MDDRIVLSLLVDNTAGVLARVAGLFSRRGYNIESLTVGVTADPVSYTHLDVYKRQALTIGQISAGRAGNVIPEQGFMCGREDMLLSE